jgi:hypothetical protein
MTQSRIFLEAAEDRYQNLELKILTKVHNFNLSRNAKATCTRATINKSTHTSMPKKNNQTTLSMSLANREYKSPLSKM